MISFRANGDPYPQGSKSAFVRGGRAVIVEGTGKGIKKHKAWRAVVKQAADEAAVGLEGLPLDCPVEVSLTFHMPRPKTVRRRWHTVKPDLDKLVRSVLDSITGNIIIDDSRVIMLVAFKVYADEEIPGVEVSVAPIEDTNVVY